jgi:phasin family protein
MSVKPTEPRKPRSARGATAAAGVAPVAAAAGNAAVAAAFAPVPIAAVATPAVILAATDGTSPVVTPSAAPVADDAPDVGEAAAPEPALPVPEVTAPTLAAAPEPAPSAPVSSPRPTPVPNPFLQESPMATAFENTQETVKTTAEAALHSSKAAMEQMTVKSREAVEQGMKSLDEITDMARGNVEALMASARTAATGIEQIATHIADVSRKSFEEASNAARAMTAAKTPNELMQLQSDYNKGQFDAAVAEFSKLSEMMVKLAGEVMEPMQNRIALATDKMKASFTK